MLCIFNGVLLALGGLNEPDAESVYACNFAGQEWSYVSTMPHGCCRDDTTALEIPEKQEIMLLKASKLLMMNGRVQSKCFV